MIGQRIGLAADLAKVRGSKVTGPPPHPLAHTWEIIGDEPGLRVHDQIARVMDRIRPYQLAIRDFVSTEPCEAVLHASRLWLCTDEGELGQHELLGWHLSADVMTFLLDVGAELKVHEHG